MVYMEKTYWIEVAHYATGDGIYSAINLQYEYAVEIQKAYLDEGHTVTLGLD